MVTLIRAGLLGDAIHAAAMVPKNTILDDVKLRLASVRLLTEGAASAIHNLPLLSYSLAVNAILRRRVACLKDIALPVDSARKLRTRPIYTSALFDNVIPVVSW